MGSDDLVVPRSSNHPNASPQQSLSLRSRKCCVLWIPKVSKAQADLPSSSAEDRGSHRNLARRSATVAEFWIRRRAEMSAPLILVLADEPDASVMCRGLATGGYEPLLTRNAASATTAIQSDSLSGALIAEAVLPNPPSTLFSQLREQTDIPNVVVGSGTQGSAVEALLDGADVYLVLPIPIELLRARLRSLTSLDHISTTRPEASSKMRLTRRSEFPQLTPDYPR